MIDFIPQCENKQRVDREMNPLGRYNQCPRETTAAFHFPSSPDGCLARVGRIHSAHAGGEGFFRHMKINDEIKADYERALLFFYLLSKGLPNKGSLLGQSDAETQINMLAGIAGWDYARAKAAIFSCMKKGLIDHVPPSL